MDDIVATLPYVLPLLFIASILILYQRHLPRDEFKRNLMVLFSIISIVLSAGLLLYAAFGGPPQGFGSWAIFSSVLQLITDYVFGSAITSLVYVAAVGILFIIFTYFVISPPEPDLAGLREDLKLTREVAQLSKQAIFKLEGENKKMNEFISEKEESLATLEGELEAIKEEVGERETSIKLMEDQLKGKGKVVPSKVEDELKTQLEERDLSISSLQTEIADLRLVLENTETAAAGPTESVTPVIDDSHVKELETKLQEIHAKWEDLTRRSETASQVSDSVISDLVELISQVESSDREDSAKQTIVSLIEGLGRSMTRVAREAGDSQLDGPKIEMIGAILMVNEIVDAIKKMVREP